MEECRRLDIMDIVINFSPNYVMPAGVMLSSLFENNKDEQITVHALLKQKGDFIKPISDIVEHYNARLCCYDMNLVNLPKLPINLRNQRPNISEEAFYRLFITDILPHDIEKALYLDCDIIIEDRLNTLWSIDINDYAVGAIPDFENDNVQITNRLGYDLENGYFNSGVLLINLKYWRENQMAYHFASYIERHFNELIFHDQDVLNYFFYKQKKVLNIKYNFQTTFLFKKRNISKRYFAQIDEAFAHPCIIHYTEDKPWYLNTNNPMRAYFDKYLKLTIWNGLYMSRQKESFREKLSHLYHYFRNNREKQYNDLYDVNYLNIHRNGKK